MRFSEWVKIDRPFFAWVPACLWGLNILVLSLLPYRLTPQLTVGHFDKLCHFSIYAVFAFLAVWGLKRSFKKPTAKNLLLVLILTIGYGILIEIFQRFVPGREACVYDVLFNSAGVFTGISFGRVTLWRK
ncbi:MAG: VanZ family protein [Candidatus Omnitrophota bacterium]